ELLAQEAIDLLRLRNLRPAGEVMAMCRLLGDPRRDELPADVRQLACGQVALQQPVVGPALVRGGLCRAGGVLGFDAREEIEDVRADGGCPRQLLSTELDSGADTPEVEVDRELWDQSQKRGPLPDRPSDLLVPPRVRPVDVE